LHLTLEITLKDALLGFTTIIDHLDDHEVEISETQVVSPGQVRKIKGEGMPVHNFPSDRGTCWLPIALACIGQRTEFTLETLVLVLVRVRPAFWQAIYLSHTS